MGERKNLKRKEERGRGKMKGREKGGKGESKKGRG